MFRKMLALTLIGLLTVGVATALYGTSLGISPLSLASLVSGTAERGGDHDRD
jgi:hypothetical protein